MQSRLGFGIEKENIEIMRLRNTGYCNVEGSRLSTVSLEGWRPDEHGCRTRERGRILTDNALTGAIKVKFVDEGVDKLDHNAVASECSVDEFRSIEASLYLVLDRTTSHEPLRIEKQTRGQRGFGAWRAIKRRYDQRNMSDKNVSICSVDQQHLREGQSKGRGAV